MRTTIDIPDEILVQLRTIARDTHRSISGVAVDLIRIGLAPQKAVVIKGRSGFPMFAAVGRSITTEDVRMLEDD